MSQFKRLQHVRSSGIWEDEPEPEPMPVEEPTQPANVSVPAPVVQHRRVTPREWWGYVQLAAIDWSAIASSSEMRFDAGDFYPSSD